VEKTLIEEAIVALGQDVVDKLKASFDCLKEVTDDGRTVVDFN
jgi:hypothetical protein